MKTIYNYIGILSFVILTILSCSKEVKVISDWDFYPTEASSVANINNPVSISGLIEEKGFSERPYSLSFKSTKTATLLYNGETYLAGETIEGITDLKINLDYLGTIGGDHDIEFIVTNAIGEVISKEISIKYNVSDFIFTAIPEDDDVELEQIMNLNYNIMEVDSGREYKLKYTIESGDFIMLDDGKIRNAGVLYDIPVGDFNWTLKPTTNENISIKFFAQNDNGVTKPATIDLTVNETNYKFSGFTTLNSLLSNNPARQNFNLVQTGIVPLSYSVLFTSTGSGTLVYNGVTYNQGQIINGITPSTFSADYIGTSVGLHEIKYTLTASDGTSKDVRVEIDFKVDPFLNVISWNLPERYYYGNRSLRDASIGFSGNFIKTNTELTGDLKMKWKQTGAGGNLDSIKLNYLIINSIGTPSIVNATPEDTYFDIPNNQDFTILFNYARIARDVSAGHFDQFLFTVTNGIQTETYQIQFITTVAP